MPQEKIAAISPSKKIAEKLKLLEKERKFAESVKSSKTEKEIKHEPNEVYFPGDHPVSKIV
jgi:hypothetical protein